MKHKLESVNDCRALRQLGLVVKFLMEQGIARPGVNPVPLVFPFTRMILSIAESPARKPRRVSVQP